MRSRLLGDEQNEMPHVFLPFSRLSAVYERPECPIRWDSIERMGFGCQKRAALLSRVSCN